MRDLATVLTTIFTILDDTMKGSAVIQHALNRPGPAPSLSDSELITTALYQELIGEPREDHFFRLHQASLQTFFPGLNERSRYNRRKRDLWSVILAVRDVHSYIMRVRYALQADPESVQEMVEQQWEWEGAWGDERILQLP